MFLKWIGLLLTVSAGAGIEIFPRDSEPSEPGFHGPESGHGLAARYPGDAGIENDPAVVFVEMFETDLDGIAQRWDHVSNRGNQVLALSDDSPPGSPGRRSLRMTATRGENTGGHLYRVFQPGYDQLYLRFYVKFAPDHGHSHHFVKLQGELNPPRMPMGGAGRRPAHSWSSGIEPTTVSRNTVPPRNHPPPGVWHFYSYWPEMRSWQNVDGSANPENPSYYGNAFYPREPGVAVPRGEWICVEMMIKLNSAPELPDGEQAFWINGEPAARFAPGMPLGYWMRDHFRNDPEHPRSAPFEGYRWRADMEVKINKLWLLHYVSDGTFESTRRHAKANPDYLINTEEAVVWFGHVVAATRYIGPLRPLN